MYRITCRSRASAGPGHSRRPTVLYRITAHYRFRCSPGVEPSGQLVLRAAVSAYLGRYRGESRLQTESDLRVFLRWCADLDLDPLTALRVDIERYLRWLQDVRRYQPS